MLKLNLLTLAMLLAMTEGPVQAQSSSTTQALPSLSAEAGTDVVGVPGCHFGEQIDGTTADDAKSALERAGYTSISGLKKSCDNHWHGHAMLNGVGTNVMVTPDGRVVQEGY